MPNKDEINQVIYQSWHRGCKETDLLLGDYAKAKVVEFDDAKFSLYKSMIEENDWDLYAWIIGKEETPEKYVALIAEIKDYSFQKYKSNRG